MAFEICCNWRGACIFVSGICRGSRVADNPLTALACANIIVKHSFTANMITWNLLLLVFINSIAEAHTFHISIILALLLTGLALQVAISVDSYAIRIH